MIYGCGGKAPSPSPYQEESFLVFSSGVPRRRGLKSKGGEKREREA